ncbi:cytochrome b [Synechococcus sp. CS-205]|nr:cytochrome b [Synechococcus sp. CS-205]
MTGVLATASKPRLTSAFQRLMSIHWWMALCYLALFLGGTLMARLDRDVFLRGSLYDVHKSIGVLTLALLGWRIFVLLQVWWKKYSKRWPKTSPKWWQSVALHAGLYIFMVAVPVAGFLLSNSFKANNVTFFGLPVPDVFPENKGMVEIGRSLHFWLAYVFLCFIILHAMLQWKVVKANWRRFTGFMRIKPIP